jgi:hypothetical protein
MDISETLAPKSDQQNFDDYLTGPRTVTVSGVTVPGGDQPVSVELAEYPGRPFKPNKSMRRVLAKAWGAESNAWIGRRMTLFGNPAVVYGGKAVGGIEIEAMSHLEKPLTMPLTAKRGQKKSFTVQPLKDAPVPAAPNPNEIPAEVVANTQKAITNGTAADYIAWLVEQGAPPSIIDWVTKETA